MGRKVFIQGVTAAFAFAAVGNSSGPVVTLAPPRISISLGSHRKLKGHVMVSVYYKTIGGIVPHIDNLVPIDGSIVWQRGVEDVGNSWFKLWRTHIDYEGQEIVFETPDADISEPPWGPEIEYEEPPTPYIETTTRKAGNKMQRLEHVQMQLVPFTREDRELAFVPRWNIVRTIRQQSVAEHSFYVALWAERVAILIGLVDLTKLYFLGRVALVHDMREIFSGDIPATFKRKLRKDLGRDLRGLDDFGTNSITNDESNMGFQGSSQIIKVADLIEAFVFCCEEQQLGNGAISEVRDDVEVQLRGAIQALNEQAHEFISHPMPIDSDLMIKGLISRHSREYTNNMYPL